MGLEAFSATFALVFLAELGDKTSLTVMTLCARHNWRGVLTGTALAFGVLNLLAVGVGRILMRMADPFWVGLGAGALFCGFGVWTLLAKEADDGPVEERKGKSLVWTSFAMIFLAELGDKTQIATAGLAAKFESLPAVFLGSTLALITVSALGAALGQKVFKRLPEKVVKVASGLVFLAFGSFALWSVLKA